MTEQDRLRPRCNTLLIALMGSEMAPKWWDSPNRAFAGELPKTVFETDPHAVYKYLMNYALAS